MLQVYSIQESWLLQNESPYSKTMTWVSKEDYFIYKEITCDKTNKKFKTIVVSEVKKTKIISGTWILKNNFLIYQRVNKDNPKIEMENI